MGTEHEKLVYNLGDSTRAGYGKIQTLLEGLCQRYGWAPVMEGDNIIGAELDGQSVSLEPGGQFELSGAPLASVHETSAEVNTHLVQVCVGGKPWCVGGKPRSACSFSSTMRSCCMCCECMPAAPAMKAPFVRAPSCARKHEGCVL
jgi:hypothetical protein